MTNFTYRWLLLIFVYAISITGLHAAGDSFADQKLISYENDDIELTATCFLSNSKDIVVFLPSIYAPFEAQETLAQEVAEHDLSACFSHAMTDLFLPTERSSYFKIPLDGLLALLHKIKQETGKSVYLIGHGSGASLAYQVAHQSQRKDVIGHASISGLLLLSANLLDGAPEPGHEQRYISLIDQKTVPVFLFQPTYSPHHWHLDKLVQQIKKSGTNIQFQRLPNVRDGYALRDIRSDEEQALREQMATMFQNAINQLARNE